MVAWHVGIGLGVGLLVLVGRLVGWWVRGSVGRLIGVRWSWLLGGLVEVGRLRLVGCGLLVGVGIGVGRVWLELAGRSGLGLGSFGLGVVRSSGRLGLVLVGCGRWDAVGRLRSVGVGLSGVAAVCLLVG